MCHAGFLLVTTTKPLDLPAKKTRLREILWATEGKDKAEFACITGKLSRTLGDLQAGIRRGPTGALYSDSGQPPNKITVAEPRGWLNDGDLGWDSTGHSDHAARNKSWMSIRLHL